MNTRRIMLVAAIVLAIAALASAGAWFWLFRDLPDINNLDAGYHTPSIRITDRYGRLLYEVISGEGRHTTILLDDIPRYCIDATIATEDNHFYTNPGVDWRGVARAAWLNLRGGEVVSGGSTITQQVIRNLLFDPQERTEQTFRRKLREAILAYQLTQLKDKDDIIALYLNQTYYGNLAYGIDAAARAYFGIPTQELDLAQCAMLAGLPQAPAFYDPLTNPGEADARQAVVLGLMVNADLINPDQAALAEDEELVFAATRYDIEAPHFVMTVYAELEERLAPEIIFAGGLEVRTTLDLDWQHRAEQVVVRQITLLNSTQDGALAHNVQNAALVAMDPHSGQVFAMLGSPDYFDESSDGAINMAVSPRQPGSTLKPFTYAAALDPTREMPWTAGTMLLDVRTSFVTREGFAYQPVNFDRLEHGPVLVREALASSYNIPAVLALQEVGVSGLLRLLAELGISTLDNPDRYDLSLTLGGGEVRLVELAAAYGALANGGFRVEPQFILDVHDSTGEEVFSAAGGLGNRVLDERVAWIITDILSDNLARAPSFSTNSILNLGRPAAVKTGTTTDFRDNWTVGFTPDLVVGVWVGNTDNSPMVDISGVAGAGPVWHYFMRSVLRGQPQLTFQRPEGLSWVEICALSGMLPSTDCPFTRLEWYIPGTEPRETDDVYQLVTIDSLTGLPADADTPADRREDRLFLALPQQAAGWARREGISLLPLQWADLPASSGDELPLVIATPGSGVTYRIAAGVPRQDQRIRVSVSVTIAVEQITLFVNGAALAVFESPPYEAWWVLEEGLHTFSAQGVTTSGQVVLSEPVTVSVVNP